MRGRCSAGMPGPVSRTRSRARPSCPTRSSVTFPPQGVIDQVEDELLQPVVVAHYLHRLQLAELELHPVRQRLRLAVDLEQERVEREWPPLQRLAGVGARQGKQI